MTPALTALVDQAEATVRDAMLVHHMGHQGERSRGDSRIRDWPDVEWRLVRQDDDPSSPRFITAFGRDVDIPESQLTFDTSSRHLTISTGSRRTAATVAALDSVLAFLGQASKQSGRQIEQGLAATEHNRQTIRDAIALGVAEGSIVTEEGPRRAVLHSQCASAPQCAVSAPARTSECASALIGGALHSDPADPRVRRDLNPTFSRPGEPRPPCPVCAEPMDPALAAAGETTHPTCLDQTGAAA